MLWKKTLLEANIVGIEDYLGMSLKVKTEQFKTVSDST
jgi:hypothetical protein